MKQARSQIAVAVAVMALLAALTGGWFAKLANTVRSVTGRVNGSAPSTPGNQGASGLDSGSAGGGVGGGSVGGW